MMIQWNVNSFFRARQACERCIFAAYIESVYFWNPMDVSGSLWALIFVKIERWTRESESPSFFVQLRRYHVKTHSYIHPFSLGSK